MPLRRGRSKGSIAANVGTLIREGYPKRQAVAIAYAKAGKSRPPARKRGRR